MSLDAVLARIDRDLPAALGRLAGFIAIPSISTDPASAMDVARCAEAFRDDLASIGFDATVRSTPGHPVVVAHRRKPGARHVLFYGHYDVQPVDPLSLWDGSPFVSHVVERDGRKVITGRGAADDKGQVMTFVEACRAMLAETGDLPFGVTILLEGEEEIGSKNLPAFVEANRDELAADIGLVCDTGMWDPETPAITSSLRGMVYQEIVVRAADRDLHSGLYGGAAQNPIHILSRLVAGLHDDNGRIQIPGFYEGVSDPSPEQLAGWKALGLTAKDFLGPIGLANSIGEKDRDIIEQIQSRPTCDINGIWGGFTGEGSKTVIPAEARAKISFRLVSQQSPERVKQGLAEFIKARIPADCAFELVDMKGSRAVELPYDSAPLQAARRALRDEWQRDVAIIGSGGSIPIVGDFKRVLGLDCILVGFGLEDDRIHSPNEKYDLTSFHKGTRSWARIIAELAKL